ncbi:MAG: tetratricopeptide repeat protein [Gemmatimonadota bacterium]
MSLWKKLFNSGEQERVDYYREGLELLKVGKFHEALTSFRLALRENPRDTAVLQQMAITYTRIGMTDEALRTYRAVLDRNPTEAGAHYGLAFLLLKEGRPDDAATHLRTFLSNPPAGAEAQRHIEHARQTLSELRGEAAAGDVH